MWNIKIFTVTIYDKRSGVLFKNRQKFTFYDNYAVNIWQMILHNLQDA